MASRMVWLFKDYQDLYARSIELERRIVEITTKAQDRLEEVESWAARRVSDLEEQLARKPALDIPSLVEELFQDIPYEDGRIPDTAWLTPGDPDRSFASSGDRKTT